MKTRLQDQSCITREICLEILQDSDSDLQTIIDYANDKS